MTALIIILWVLAIIAWVLATFGVTISRISLIAAGLVFAGLATLIPLIAGG